MKKIGLFSEEDAKKIARLFRQVNREPKGNKPRHRRRVATGGGGELVRFRLCEDLDRCGTAQAIKLPEGCEDTDNECDDCPDPPGDCEDVRITVEDTLGLAELAFNESAEAIAPAGSIGFAKPRGSVYEIVSIGLGCCEEEPPCPQIPGVPMEAIPVATEKPAWLLGFDADGCLVRVPVAECACEDDEPPPE